MAEAGFTPENPLKLQLRYNTNENHQRIAVAITAMWKQIGVQTELFNAEIGCTTTPCGPVTSRSAAPAG